MRINIWTCSPLGCNEYKICILHYCSVLSHWIKRDFPAGIANILDWCLLWGMLKFWSLLTVTLAAEILKEWLVIVVAQILWKIHLISEWVYKRTATNHIQCYPKWQTTEVVYYSSSRDDGEAEKLCCLVTASCQLGTGYVPPDCDEMKQTCLTFFQMEINLQPTKTKGIAGRGDGNNARVRG